MRNSFRITKAKLVAERTNAELMVAIKQEMNFGEDIDMFEDRKSAIRDRLMTEEDWDKIDALDLEWDEIGEELEWAIIERSRLQAEISDLTARVSETLSYSLTISAIIDQEEAVIALDAQSWREWELIIEITNLATTIANYEMQLLFSFDPIQQTQYEGILDGLYVTRVAMLTSAAEQAEARADLENAYNHAAVALTLSEDLALGTTEGFEQVLDTAPDAAALA